MNAADDSLSAPIRWALSILRALPAAMPGKLRIARRLLRSVRGATALTTRQGLRLWVPDVREPIAVQLAANGEYEGANARLLGRWLQDGGDFIDVGANIGSIALPVLRLAAVRHALLIEPEPLLAELLTRNLSEAKISNAQIKQCLCGETNSLNTPFWAAPLDHFGAGARGAQFHSTPATLPMRSLDSLVAELRLTQVRAIKVDVEGYEREVFEGAKHLLATQRPNILFEFMDWAEVRRDDKDVGGSQRVLLEADYAIFTRDDWLKRKKPISKPKVFGSFDFVAFPREKCDPHHTTKSNS